jgi:hypothetical protein
MFLCRASITSPRREWTHASCWDRGRLARLRSHVSIIEEADRLRQVAPVALRRARRPRSQLSIATHI